MNHSPIYSRFEDTKDLILDDQSDLWNERFEEVSCNLYSSDKFYDTMMLTLLILDIINLRVKREPSQWTIIKKLFVKEIL